MACTFVAAQAEVASAADISAIMAGLESDAQGTAERLLALGPEADRDPQMIHAFVNAARTVGRKGDWKQSIALLTRARQAHQTKRGEASSPDNVSDDFVYTMDLAIASASMQCDQFDRAIEHCQNVIADSKAPAPHRSAAFPLLVKAYRCQDRLDEA
ncbi:MAG: tetratricopeptide repeat protein, partial [Planctomycetaceae bacterium]